MWPFNKRKLKTYKIKWAFIPYCIDSPGVDIVQATSLAKAWGKVCKMHYPYQIRIMECEVLEEE